MNVNLLHMNTDFKSNLGGSQIMTQLRLVSIKTESRRYARIDPRQMRPQPWQALRNTLMVYIYNVKARSHRQNVAGAFLERWGEGAEFWQRSSPRTKWHTKSKTRALP